MSDPHAPEAKRRRFFGVKSAAAEAAVCLAGSLIVLFILFWLWATRQAPMLPTVAAFVVGIGALVLFGIRLATLNRIGQRGRYQFSLRLLLVFALVVALACSWLTVQIHRAHRQREAVAALRKAGVEVYYDSELAPPRFLEDLVGVDFLSDVVAVDSRFKGPVCDADMVHVKRLTSLERLDLSGPCSGITDTGLEQIRELTSLRFLDLSGTLVSDAGLEHLRELTSLRDLCLRGTQVSDAGLECVARLPNLEYLDVSETRVSREALEKLQQRLPDCFITISYDQR